MAAREMIDQRLNAKNKNAAVVGCIQEIRTISNIRTLNEAQAKLKIIQRILSSLDWDIYRDIDPEHGLETRKSVDYTLQVSGKNKVFIEAKSPKEDLEKEEHQKQLFNYSAQRNPDLAILTDGILWWFYLPRAEGAWDDRKFYTIDILEQEIENIADKFGLLLSNKNVASGEAVRQAESILKNRQKEKAIRESLLEAWNSVIKEPHELLVEILIETVEEVCGFKPENSEIREFIRNHHEKWLLFPELEQEVPTPIDSETESSSEDQPTKPKRMQIGSESYELRYGYEILLNTANWLIDKGDLRPSDYPIRVVKGSRYLINNIPKHTEHKLGVDFRGGKTLKNDLFIETAYGNPQGIEYAKRLLEKYGYDPEILKIDY